MPTPDLDPEVIAALLDGRLQGEPRERALARIAASDEWSEVFADAAAALHDEPDAGAPVVPLRRPRPWVRPLAIAAAAAGIALVPLLAVRGGRDDGPVAALGDARAGLPAGWGAPPWGEVRSGADVLSPEARAVRVGLLSAELEVAAAAGDPSARPLAERAAALLEGAPAGAGAASVFRGVARRARAVPAAEVRRARAEAARLLGAEGVEFGAWLGAARIAAARGDAEFFGASGSRGALDRPPASVAPEVWARVRRGAGPPPRWPELRAALDEVAAGY